jgi:hypothetical protein
MCSLPQELEEARAQVYWDAKWYSWSTWRLFYQAKAKIQDGQKKILEGEALLADGTKDRQLVHLATTLPLPELAWPPPPLMLKEPTL